VEHPAAEAHRLQRQDPGEARAGQLGGDLGQHVLVEERERERVVHVHEAAVALHPRDRPAVHVVREAVAVLDEETDAGQRVLGEVTDGDREQ
jgi:hypothetical protein